MFLRDDYNKERCIDIIRIVTKKISNLNVFTCAFTKLTGYGQKSFCILNTLGTIKARVF